LDFLSPGGAATGRLLPSGNAVDELHVGGIGIVEASLIDAANAVVFVRAADLGKSAIELPDSLDNEKDFMEQVEKIRCAGSVAMGLAGSSDKAERSTPKVAILGEARSFTSLDGEFHALETHDLNVRLVSMGKFHRAITLTGGMCAAVAAQVPGSLVQQISNPETTDLKIGTPSGVLNVTAEVRTGPNGPEAVTAGTYRTQRRIMEGAVLFPGEFLEEGN
ncbi:MAG: PrpF family protein, partial [Roseibium sp.]|uniref:PrpF domain-containing protein n=1 Tax=Roseibium sp. TaxID=1936156 RepID=UPI002622783A